MPKSLGLFILILSGCVVNPKYTDSQRMAQEQAQKYPQNTEQIMRQHEDFRWQQNYLNSQAAPKNSYQVYDEKTSGWSIGDPNAFLHLGVNNYRYHHKINIKLVCNKDSFMSQPYGHKKIRWKISQTLFGEVETLLNGEADIRFVTESNESFHKISFSTSENSYETSLDGYLILELKPEECYPQ